MRKWMIVVVVVLCALCVCACAQKPLVGISLPSGGSARWTRDGEDLKAGLEALGYRTELYYTDQNPQAQTQCYESLLRAGAKLLIVTATDTPQLQPVLDKAEGKRVPIIAYDRLMLQSDAVDFYVSFDNAAVGEMQAHYVMDAMAVAGLETATIEIFAGAKSDANAQFLYNGMLNILAPQLANGKLQNKSAEQSMEQVYTKDWSREAAKQRMARLLADVYPGDAPDVVIAHSDNIAMGVLEALEEAGITDLPIITGQDGAKENVRAIIDGRQSMTLFKDTRILAQKTVAVAKQLLEGKTPQAQTMVHNGAKDVPALLVPPQLVDKNNYEQVLVNSGYYTTEDLKRN